MATPQLSPGVLIREVDLTVGRAENVLDNLGAIAGPFYWSDQLAHRDFKRAAVHQHFWNSSRRISAMRSG